MCFLANSNLRSTALIFGQNFLAVHTYCLVNFASIALYNLLIIRNLENYKLRITKITSYMFIIPNNKT